MFVRFLFSSVLLSAAASVTFAAPQSEVQQLSGLSLAQLSRVEVTSVTKHPQSLGTAAASVYVITHDEILRGRTYDSRGTAARPESSGQ